MSNTDLHKTLTDIARTPVQNFHRDTAMMFKTYDELKRIRKTLEKLRDNPIAQKQAD